MASFLARATLEYITQKDDRSFEGKFILDAGTFNAYREFRFKIRNSLFVVYKGRSVFVKGKGVMPNREFAKYREEQKIVLTMVKRIFQAWQGRFNVKEFALTRIEPGNKVSFTTVAPDQLTLPLIRACL